MKSLKKISYLLFIFVALFCLTKPVFAETLDVCKSLGDNVEIDSQLVDAISTIVLVLQIAIPILLVIFGSIDFVKAVVAQKEDEIKKGQQTFIKRTITAIIVFFVFVIVKLVVSFAAGDESANIMNCASCFLKGSDDSDCQASASGVQDNNQNTQSNQQSKTN